MKIELAQNAPLLLKAAAQMVLVTHIGGASVGLISGTVSFAAKKGSATHRLAGKVFVGAMMAMGAAGAVAAPFLPIWAPLSGMMGLFVCYLVTTSWMTLRRAPGEVGRFEPRAAMFGAAVGVLFLGLAMVGALGPKGIVGVEPYQLGFVVAAIAALAVTADLNGIRAGGFFGPPRLRRHIWRMSLALAVTWGSFAGQPTAQPAFLKGSPLLAVPPLVVLGLMVYWLTRYRDRRPARRQSAAAA